MWISSYKSNSRYTYLHWIKLIDKYKIWLQQKTRVLQKAVFQQHEGLLPIHFISCVSNWNKKCYPSSWLRTQKHSFHNISAERRHTQFDLGLTQLPEPVLELVSWAEMEVNNPDINAVLFMGGLLLPWQPQWLEQGQGWFHPRRMAHSLPKEKSFWLESF